MPEMRFEVEWPDGRRSSCYSPSLVMHDYLTVGQSYPVEEFLRRSTEALESAAERVRARFGFSCTSAAAQQDALAAAAARYQGGDQCSGGTVTVLSMEPPLPEGPAPAAVATTTSERLGS